MAGDPTLIDRYEVVKPIGQGGMGTLYLAYDPKLDRQLAIKVLKGDDPELRERFAREARSAARLRHPHIVTIFDVGDHQGQPYIAMEYIQGVTLATVIREWKPLTTARKLELIEELCDGLAYAHRAGIVHRDIKPANLIVSAEGQLKILDFGIARLMQSAAMTQVGRVIGTLNYMSPEQMTGRDVDSRSDIFAVGLVFYELLAHRQAFPGGLGDGVFNRILNEKPEPLATHARTLDPEVIQIVERAVEKRPEDRYQDLATVRTEVRRVRTRLQSADDSTSLMDVDHDVTFMGAAPTMIVAAETTIGSTPMPATPATPITAATGPVAPLWVPPEPPPPAPVAPTAPLAEPVVLTAPAATIAPPAKVTPTPPAATARVSTASVASKSTVPAAAARPRRPARPFWIVGVVGLVIAIAIISRRGNSNDVVTPPPAATSESPVSAPSVGSWSLPTPTSALPAIGTWGAPVTFSPLVTAEPAAKPAPPPPRTAPPKPATQKPPTPPPPRKVSPECAKLLERVSLGEELTAKERAFIQTNCGVSNNH